MYHERRRRIGKDMRSVVVFTLAVLLIGCDPDPKTDPTGSGTDTTTPTTTSEPEPAVSCPAGATTGPPIEVTQAIQTETNTVQLIADRATAVRVRAAAGDLADDVYTGVLHVYVGGTEVTPGGVNPLNGPVTAPAAVNRDDVDHTLNFELTAPTGIVESTDVEVCVELTPAAGGDVEVAAVSGLDVAAADNPRLFYVSVDYDGLGLPAAGDIQPGVGDAFVRGIFPFDDSDPDLYRESPTPTLVNSSDVGTPQFVDQGTDVSNLLADLGAARQLIVVDGQGADDSTFLYGWLPGNPISGNGWASVGGRVAFGNTQLSRSQRTYAHELGHNFGLNHNSRTLAPDTGWDTGARLDGNPAGNNTSGSVRPSTLNDIMRGGQLTNTAWVDVPSYEFFLDDPILGLGDAPDADAEGDRLTRRVAVITGVLTPDGSGVQQLFPVQRFPWASGPTRPPEEAGYVAIVEADGDTLTVPFGGRIAGDEDGSELEGFGYFEVMVPVAPEVEIDAVTIATAAGEPLAAVAASAPPEVFWEAPQEGGSLEGIAVWFVEDPDTPLEEIVVQIVFSPDGGESWVPVAVNLPGSVRRIAFDPRLLPPSDGNGVLRVIASDGLNTTVADVGSLS